MASDDRTAGAGGPRDRIPPRYFVRPPSRVVERPDDLHVTASWFRSRAEAGGRRSTRSPPPDSSSGPGRCRSTSGNHAPAGDHTSRASRVREDASRASAWRAISSRSTCPRTSSGTRTRRGDSLQSSRGPVCATGPPPAGGAGLRGSFPFRPRPDVTDYLDTPGPKTFGHLGAESTWPYNRLSPWCCGQRMESAAHIGRSLTGRHDCNRSLHRMRPKHSQDLQC